MSIIYPRYNTLVSLITLSGMVLQTIILRAQSGEEPSGKTSGLILDMIRRQPEITIPEMAESLGEITRAIELQLAKLKRSGKVQRIGPAKGGHLEITEGGDE
jgi:ATP-dependent DNA helicase RecG